jgi:predicted glycosyltransferase
MGRTAKTCLGFGLETYNADNARSAKPLEPKSLPVEKVVISEATRNEPTRRVWIDLDNSPHVPFFIPIIDELRKQGIAVTLTARDAYQVRALLEFYKVHCEVIGGHAGKNKVLKVLGSCTRALQLAPTVARAQPDLGLSHGSRAQVLVCKLFNIPAMVIEDYEFATKTGFLEPDWIVLPDVIPDRAMSKHTDRVMRYSGLKEDVYVSRFRPDPGIYEKLKISGNPLIAMLRPPADEAHYHNPESDILFAEVLRFLGSRPGVLAIVLPRNERQKRRLWSECDDLLTSGKMIIPDRPLDGLSLVWFSDLVVSGGGTMNREAAALGVPAYSVFRGKIGAVDRHLVQQGRLILIENLKDVQKKIRLKRWNRPVAPDSKSRPALAAILRHVVSKVNARRSTAEVTTIGR